MPGARGSVAGLKEGDKIRVKLTNGLEVHTRVHAIVEPKEQNMLTYVDRKGNLETVHANQVRKIA